MVKKLNVEDRERAMEFLAQESSINLFIIGDIENHGFNEDFMEVFGRFNEEGNIEGVLLRYFESYICYYKEGFKNGDEFKEIIKKNAVNTMISGKDNIVQDLKDIYDEYSEKKTYFCELKSKDNLGSFGDEVRLATEEDGERIYEFLNSIPEFENGGSDSVKKIKDRIRDKISRIYYIENEEGEIICSAQTTAENSSSAMIMCVATDSRYRGQGFVTKCLSRLCSDLISDGKTLCLFYLNHNAGRIYHKLGFKTIGEWTLVVKK